MKKHLFFLFLVWNTLNTSAQNGVSIRISHQTDSTTTIGKPASCSDCCYKWSPETGLDDPSKANPIVTDLPYSTVYAVTISYPDGNYIEDDVLVTVYETDIQVYHPDYHLINTMLPEEEEKIPGVQSFVNLDNDDCDADFDFEDIEISGGDNEFIKMRVLMNIFWLQRPGKAEGSSNKGPSQYKAAT